MLPTGQELQNHTASEIATLLRDLFALPALLLVEINQEVIALRDQQSALSSEQAQLQNVHRCLSNELYAAYRQAELPPELQNPAALGT